MKKHDFNDMIEFAAIELNYTLQGSNCSECSACGGCNCRACGK